MIKTISQTEFQRSYPKYEKMIQEENAVVVYKNNEPAFVALSVEEYSRLIDEDVQLIAEAVKRYAEIKQGKRKTVKLEDVWDDL